MLSPKKLGRGEGIPNVNKETIQLIIRQDKSKVG